MSLLIKALASAEKGKQAELGKGAAEPASSAGLMLEPLVKTESAVVEKKQDSNTVDVASANREEAFHAAATASLAKVRQQSEHKKESSQQAAANVFVANQSAQKPASIATLITMGAIGALLILLVLQVYQYFHHSGAMQTQVMPPALPPAATMGNVQSPNNLAQPKTGGETVTAGKAGLPATQELTNTQEIASSAPRPEQIVPTSADKSLFASAANSVDSKPESVQPSTTKKTSGHRVDEEGEVSKQVSKEFSKTSPDVPKSATPLKLVARTPAAGVDPVLLSAYEAYSRGDDTTAQTQYRQVLQADTRNVDALLGMAAIAVRQSRHVDANGWYQKVLEIEPRNSVALSAIASLEISGQSAGAGAEVMDYAASESRIKNMLAQQPDSANLHAALGNLYAARNQWTLAQAAYFDACRYAPNSADYAFNLAVSLDQLGKSALALTQYQRALDLMNSSGTGRVDKAQLQARIKALQE